MMILKRSLHSSPMAAISLPLITAIEAGNFYGDDLHHLRRVKFPSLSLPSGIRYFHSLPYLLWKTPFPTVLRVMLFIGVEFSWNVFPSSMYSSAMLLFLHLVILVGLWSAPPEYPYVDDKASTENKDK